jgi:ketosteroid isomerase-like protein
MLGPALVAAAPSDHWRQRALSAAAPDIDRANDEWTRAIVTGDADVMSAPYDTNGVFIGPDGSAVRGKDQVRAMYAKPRPAGLNVLSASIHSEGRAAATPDEVYEWGSADMKIQRDGKVKATSGRYLTVWHREGAHWRITRNIAF